MKNENLMIHTVKIWALAALAACAIGACANIAGAKPRGPKALKGVPVRVTFAPDVVRATPRAYTREPGQTCSRRKLEQGRGSVTICTFGGRP